MHDGPGPATHLRGAAALAVLCLLALPGGACSSGCVEHPNDVRALLADNCGPTPQPVGCIDPCSGAPIPGRPQGFAPLPPSERVAPPAEAGPYRIGVGDVLYVTVPGLEQFSSLGETRSGEIVGNRVKEDGHVYLPLLQGVPAAGRSVLEVQEDIRQRLTKYLKEPFVSVDVVTYNSQKYYVLGEVGEPGVFAVDGKTRLVEAVARAGGLKNGKADAENAYVLRQGKTLAVNLGDAVLRGDRVSNVVMEDGDIVYVPDRSAEKVYVVGEVKQAQIVPMNRGHLSLAEALAACGGLDGATAAQDQIRIFRGGWVAPRAYTLSYHEVHKYGEDILLKPGDRVFAAPSGLATWGRALQGVTPLLATLTSAAAIAVSVEALGN